MGALTVGVDIGQKRDPTAIAVVEGEQRSVDGSPVYYHKTVYLKRLPLGTSYPDVATRVAEVVRNAYRQALRGAPVQQTVVVDPNTGAGLVERTADVSVRLFADATGVGQPIIDLLRVAGITPIAVYFTHGDKRVVKEDGTISLGKGWLVSRLQALLQTHRLLTPPDSSEASAMVTELQNYERKTDPDGDDKYGAFKTGTHDDLVTALGLATMDDPLPPEEFLASNDLLPYGSVKRGKLTGLPELFDRRTRSTDW